MAIGEKILTSNFEKPLNEVNKSRARFGLANSANPVTKDKKTLTLDYNNLVDWLTEAKNKAGSNVAMPSKITVGTIMYSTSLDSVTNSAVNLYNWCKCHGNCSGSCTGSCTGNCKGSCVNACTGGCDWTSSDSGD